MTITIPYWDLPESYAYLAAWLLFYVVVSLLCRRLVRRDR